MTAISGRLPGPYPRGRPRLVLAALRVVGGPGRRPTGMLGCVRQVGAIHLALVLAAVRRRRALVDGVPAAHLVAEHVDVVVEVVGRRMRRGVGERDGAVDALDRLAVHRLALLLVEQAGRDELVAEDRERVALAPGVDLLLGAVLLGI